MTAMPWAELFRAGVTRLGLSPLAFWAMSLAEWNMLASAGTAPLGRDKLNALLARYPDNEK